MAFRLKKRYKYLKVLIFFFLAFGGLGILVILNWPKSPEAGLKAAHDAVLLAREAESDKYAPKEFQKSIALYDSAMYYWKIENQKFFFTRDFSKAVKFAGEAARSGLKTATVSAKKAREVHHTTAATLTLLEKQANEFDKLYGPLPIPKKLREDFNIARLLLTEARLAREKNDFHIAEDKLETVEKMFEKSIQEAKTMVEIYFQSVPKWKGLVENAISKSAQLNSSLIVVEKMAGECRIYKDGKLKDTFTAEFGPNWMSDKYRRGDNATPEGQYLVTSKKDKRQTIYYKALLLNYPNRDDRERNSSKTDLGGLIEIHGHGGRGFNWTNGCVGLANGDMDIVFRMSSENTPVVIVGSLLSFDEWIKSKNDE